MTLLELLQLMRKHLKLMIVLPIVCALATAAVCFVALPNTYTASTSMYVLAKQSSANSDNAANYSNLNASQMMANDVSTLLKSDRIEADTAKDLHLESLKGYSTKVTSETTSSWCPICSTRRCATPTRLKTCWACPSSAACLLSREVNKLWLANLKAATIWRCRTPRRP